MTHLHFFLSCGTLQKSGGAIAEFKGVTKEKKKKERRGGDENKEKGEKSGVGVYRRPPRVLEVDA